MRFPEVALRLPDWVGETLADRAYPTVEDRMRLAIELSRCNIQHATGGPFGAAIFERETGRLLAPGVNLVTSLECSVFHAEMVAIMIAQSVAGTSAWADLGIPRTSSSPARSRAPCASARPPGRASGASCAAPATRTPRRQASTRVGSLEGRGISVERDVLRDEAASVLREYTEKGGEIYNSRRGGL